MIKFKLITFQKRIHMPLGGQSWGKVLKFFVRLFKTFSTQSICTTPPTGRANLFTMEPASRVKIYL